jgi:hypothetical protein
MRVRTLILPLVLVAASACRRGGDAVTGAGTVAVRWTVGDTTIGSGSWSGPADAGWCDSTSRLAVLAFRGDTGVALLVRHPATAAGSYPLLVSPDSSTPMSAVAALRWYGGTRVVAVTSRSGLLELDGATPTASGRFDAVAPTPDGEDSVVFQGTLTGVPVRTGAAGCRVAGAGVP